MHSDIYNDNGVKRLITHSGAGKFKDIVLFVRALLIFLVLVIQSKVDLVHAHMSYNASFWRKYIFFLLCRAFTVPFICHLHGSEFKGYVKRSGRIRSSRLKHLARGADTFLVLSRSWKEYVDECFGINSVILPNYIDLADKHKNKNLDGEGDIIFVGAFIERKGVLDLIKAFYQANLNCNLRLCGSGPLLEEAKALVQEYQINSKVIFHGWVSGDEKYNIFSKSSVFVLPTYNEGLPLTILEAFATRTFVISTPVGAIPEVVIENKSGLLFPAGNISCLKDRLTFYFNNRELCNQMIHEAYCIYESNYTSKSVMPILKQVYENAVVKKNENLV
jgi:glycosyltransferase involved in cell wall biosynthesis